MGESARVRIVRAAQSDELREIFRQLTEIDGPAGPRFSRRVLVDLAARIVGRAYEPMLLELAHLARAALLAGTRSAAGWRSRRRAAGAGFEWLFWGVEEARAGAYRAAFSPLLNPGSSRCPSSRSSSGQDAGDDGLVVGDEAVILVYPEGRFEVRYARMASLAAMMELLVSVLGYRALVAALDPLAAPALRRGAVSGAARSLARRLYAWLADHLPAAQAQRKFRAMTLFLEETHGPDFTEEDVDDETVLRFWLRHAVPPGDGGNDARGVATAPGDFRGFRTTFLAFVALLRVLEAGAALGRFERKVPIGPDGRSGEIDPAAGRQDLHGTAEDTDPLARLQEAPADAVKVLNCREIALLTLPVGESAAVRRLPRSWLRAECFGPVQNRLSQALRRRAGAAELAALATTAPDPDYRGRIEALEKTAGHLARAARASLYVLHRGRAAGDETGETTTLDFRVASEARRAFEGLNRAGFERSAPHDPRLVSAHAALAEHLPLVIERLGAVLRTFVPSERWAAAEAEDRPVFADAFVRLYASQGTGAAESASSGARGSDRASRAPAPRRAAARGTSSPVPEPAGERP